MDFLLRYILNLFLVVQLLKYGNTVKYCYSKNVFRPQIKQFGSMTMYPIDYRNKSLNYYLPGKVSH